MDEQQEIKPSPIVPAPEAQERITEVYSNLLNEEIRQLLTQLTTIVKKQPKTQKRKRIAEGIRGQIAGIRRAVALMEVAVKMVVKPEEQKGNEE